MSVLTTLGVFNYGLVLLYGLFLSTFISGGWENTKQRTLVFAACPLFLMIQSVCWLALGADMARQLYPLITHLPLALILICILKKEVDVALVSVCTAYLCCQLPRWVDLVVTALTRSELIGEICYTGDRAAVLSALPLLRPPGLRGHDGLAAVAAFIRQPAGGVLFL